MFAGSKAWWGRGRLAILGVGLLVAGTGFSEPRLSDSPAETLLDICRDNCPEPDECTYGLRRDAAIELANNYTESFLRHAEEMYAKGDALAPDIAMLFWSTEVLRAAPQKREELLWKIFDGSAEGRISATEFGSVKFYAVGELCETGTHDRFDELRSHLRSLWHSVPTVVEEVTYCRERYEAVRRFGSRWDASIAMLNRETPCTTLRTRSWALGTINEQLNTRPTDERAEVEKALVSAALQWQSGDIRESISYSTAYRLLSAQFGWRQRDFEQAGMTQMPSVH